MAEWSLTTARLQALRPVDLAMRPRERLRVPRLRVPRKDLQIFPDVVARKDLLRPELLFCVILCPPRLRVRKNQKDITPTEWARFIHAIEALAEAGIPGPTYADFVSIHDQAMTTAAGMMWGAHTMGGSDGRNFLTWHREYLAKLEARLRLINPLVTIPYWNWVEDRSIPAAISTPADLAEWGVTRGSSFNGAGLPDATWINSVLGTGVSPPSFTAFTHALEAPHNVVHNLVGGTMGTSRSPADPLFWLHHAFIDKLWAQWEAANTGTAFNPPNAGETLQPPPIMTRTVAGVLSIQALGYVYA